MIIQTPVIYFLIVMYEEHHVDKKKKSLLSHWLTTPASGLQGIPTMGAVLFLRLLNPMK